MTIADHQRMVADRLRVDRYGEALRRLVRPGDTVVDVGTGTGLLAVLAAQAGAGRVYGLEWGSIHTVARQVAAANGLGDRITVLAGDARQQALPEPADCLVSELLGSFGLEENVLPILLDARQRHLKPGGRLIPGRLALELVPVSAPATNALLSFWDQADLGLDLSPVTAAAKADLQRADPADLQPLAEAGCWQDLDLATFASPHLHGALRFTVATPGTCHGFAGWFRAELAPDLWLANGPGDPPTHWGTAFLPLARPLAVSPGDGIELELKSVYALNRTYWSWRWRWQGRHGQAEGTGGSDELWAELATPAAAPQGPLALSDDGRLVATVLRAWAGAATEADLVAACQEAAGSEAAARKLVRRLIAQYGRPGPA